jgi:hypothetical protein
MIFYGEGTLVNLLFGSFGGEKLSCPHAGGFGTEMCDAIMSFEVV